MAIVRVSGTVQTTNGSNSPTTISSPNAPVKITAPSLIIVNTATVNTTGSNYSPNPYSIVITSDAANVGNPSDTPYDPTDVYDTAFHRQLGSVYISGGLGVEKDLNVGGHIYGRISEAVTSSQLVVTSTNVDSTFFPLFVQTLQPASGTTLYGDSTGTFSGLTYNPAQGKLTVEQLNVTSSTQSTSTTTGAVHVKGGVGIEGNLTVDDIYTKVLRSLEGKIQINPADGMTEVVGDIRVLGQNPIGTAPVVTNVLYVTMDGDDTNDGRAQDPSRACRTITGAVNSPFYQPGTQIRVSPGHYLEDNPIRLKPYTSIMGSDIRTTGVEPINKTQDLFHLDSGCYLAFMQFLNGRSGLLEGPYAAGFNRGAYCTAFPPLEGDDRIDLFHSPYVQNCTNLSGPWLKDGTLFTPNQTVQVPLGVGIGSWPANTTTIVVNVSTGTIELGMAINAGQQNQGFFNARTLMLASKPFLQEQVVAFVNQTFPGFEYSQEKCFRDVGILVENIAYDAAFGGNQKAVESGLAYYNGVVSLIAGQETQTTAAISYLNDLIQFVITNDSAPDVLSGSGLYSQTINTVLTGGSVASDSISSLFNIINTIITNGPTAAPDVYTSTGPDAAFVSAEILMQANRKFIQEDTINWINNKYKQFPYSKEKCKRDVGIIIDSIAGDMLYPTTNFSQSNFAGLQYWSQGAYTGEITSEITTTTAAVSYLRDLSAKIILGTTEADDAIVGVTRYQNTSTQDTSIQPGTEVEVAAVTNSFATILNILGGNKDGWTDKIIPNGTASQLLSVIHAYELLEANKLYLQDEVIAFIEATMTPGFVYDQTKCRRDIGYMIDSVGFDLLHGGNRQAIQAGLSYYAFSTSTSSIHYQETETVEAFNYLRSLLDDIVQNNLVDVLQTKFEQNTSLPVGDVADSAVMAQGIDLINTIISTGPSAANTQEPIGQSITSSPTGLASWKIIEANKDFIKEQVTVFIDRLYNPNSFQYDEALCYRDTGLLIDAVSQDILLGGNQKSIESGLAYWNKGYNYVSQQLTTTTSAINYARDLALQVIANKTVIPQQGTSAQQVINTFFQYGGDYMPQEAVRRNFGIITDIINRGPQYAPPVYAGGGIFALTGINGLDVKIAPTVTSVENYAVYDETLCRRDSGYIIDGVYFDTALETNYNAVTCGNAYRRGVSSVVLDYELSQTLGAIRYMKTNSETIMSSNTTAVSRAIAAYDEVINVIEGAYPTNLFFTNPVGANANNISAKDQLIANKEFIKEEVVGWIQSQIDNNVPPFVDFTYNSDLCSRDVGFIIDALCYDMIYGGNSATRNCARAYFSTSGVSQIPGENLQSVAAFNHMLNVAQDVIRGNTISRSANVYLEQSVTGPFATNIEAGTLGILVSIITDVITAGSLSGLPAVGNPSIGWVDGGIQTAVNALDAAKNGLIDDTITYVNAEFAKTYLIGLSAPTVGFGNNATLYFGNTAVYPALDPDVPDEWAQRRMDPIGGMGGSLVDGKVISTRSPIQSFVYDAFTQLTQGGRGVHVTNDGYAQLVSVFTIFSSVGVQTDNGGIASIVNSNANFGDICLLSKGYGQRKFSGTVFNPSFKAYPVSPGPDGLDQYFPFGYWPNNGRLQVFVPDADDRPHISLVMEVVPPETYFDVNGNIVPFTNDQGFPGFLNAAPTKATLSTGTIVITDINTDGIFVGNTVYIRDQNNSITGVDGNMYAGTGTTVVDIGYRSVTLSKALESGGVDPEFGEANTNWFNLYFCGNSYYSVLSSEVANNPSETGTNILAVSTVTGITVNQVPAHVEALQHLNDIINQIIDNQSVITSPGTTEPQFVDGNIVGGLQATTFINQRFTDMINIINAVDINAAEAVIPKKLRDKTGTITSGAGDAIALIQHNFAFITDEIANYVNNNNTGGIVGNYNVEKCKRDTGLILQRLIYDIESGGRYNSVMTGLSYWSRNGTHHIVQLGENVRRNDLFPDGAAVNFYQRSYISASGYVFEYVGAGTNYGSLPQVGRADPVQGKETVQLDSGKVFFTSTDQNGDFRIGPGLVISQATGVLSGRTFTKSLFANMTPFILAIEGGGI